MAGHLLAVGLPRTQELGRHAWVHTGLLCSVDDLGGVHLGEPLHGGPLDLGIGALEIVGVDAVDVLGENARLRHSHDRAHHVGHGGLGGLHAQLLVQSPGFDRRQPTASRGSYLLLELLAEDGGLLGRGHAHTRVDAEAGADLLPHLPHLDQLVHLDAARLGGELGAADGHLQLASRETTARTAEHLHDGSHIPLFKSTATGPGNEALGSCPGSPQLRGLELGQGFEERILTRLRHSHALLVPVLPSC